MVKLPEGNIYWRDAIAKKCKIKDAKVAYTACGKVVYWNGQEAVEAQTKLRNLAKKR